MSKIVELRLKRAKLWEDTKKFLDSAKRDNNGMLSAADAVFITVSDLIASVISLGSPSPFTRSTICISPSSME